METEERPAYSREAPALQLQAIGASFARPLRILWQRLAPVHFRFQLQCRARPLSKVYERRAISVHENINGACICNQAEHMQFAKF